MKTIKRSFLLFLAAISILSVSAQTKAPDKLKIAVLGIDAQDVVQTSESLAHLTRLKLQEVPNLNVFRHYDVIEEFHGQEQRINACFSVKCLSEVGKELGADQMLSGTVERFGERIVINLVLVDVSEGAIIASDVNNYYNIGSEIEGMIEISVNNLFGIETENALKNALEKSESILSDQVVERLKLNGPRMGVGFVAGEQGQRLSDSKEENGYGMLPIMTQFGYQMEWQYLSAGNLQALVEVIPIISGMDQGRFIPSITLMNGFRHSKTGVEFAFGPTFRVNQVALGYYDQNNVWRQKSYWAETETLEDGSVPENPNDVHENIDSKGDFKLSYGFTLAAGKTFKSGHLNVPVNVFVTPNLHGVLFGASFGFNVRTRRGKTEKL
jgi:TolB-like protein